MRNKNLSYIDYQIFICKTLFWLSLAGSGFVLALSDSFYAELAWILPICFGAWLVYYVHKNNVLAMISKEMIIISILILLIVILYSSFSTPTVFSGRDQGSISEAAVRLAQNHTFEFSTPTSQEFFKLHSQGIAQNFPGFYYIGQEGNLTTQFPLIYIVWLASFYALFGITGFVIANAVLMYIFLFSFYLLTRIFLKPYSAFPTILFAATSFIFMWFAKYTLSENMALALLWVTILSLMLFLQNLRKMYYVFLISVGLLFFTRIEGIAFLAISIGIICYHTGAREYVKNNLFARFFLPAGIFLAVFVANLVKDISFYHSIAKALLPEVTAPQAQYLGTMANTVTPIFYTGRIFMLYGILGFFIVGAVGILIFAWRKKLFKLVPFFIVLPTFVYFLDAYITMDHPWMLRRFMFSLVPMAIFYSGLLIGQMLEKKFTQENKQFLYLLALILTITLTLTNLFTFSRYLTFSENKGLLSQVKALSENFSDKDLVLIDRETTDDGWNMISGPMGFLFGKNAVYFFNNNDLARLDLTKFDKVYLIAPSQQVPFYLSSTIKNRLTEKDSYTFTFPKLDNTQDNPKKTISYPTKKEVNISGKIFEISK